MRTLIVTVDTEQLDDDTGASSVRLAAHPAMTAEVAAALLHSLAAEIEANGLPGR